MKKEIIYTDKDQIKSDLETVHKLINAINESNITKDMLTDIIQDREKFLQ